MIRTLQQFAAAGHGRLQGQDRDFNEIAIDSRRLVAGDLFAALRGSRPTATSSCRPPPLQGPPAPSWRARFSCRCRRSWYPMSRWLADAARAARAVQGPVIGVAGSNGKTTVKEMIAAILSQRGPCLSTRGNLNNHLGVPMTLLRLDDSHVSAVIEMGANRRGDVEQLVQIARPGIGLITNAGAEHLEGFGSLEGAARAEGEIVAGCLPAAPRSSMPTMPTPRCGVPARPHALSASALSRRRTFMPRRCASRSTRATLRPASGCTARWARSS